MSIYNVVTEKKSKKVHARVARAHRRAVASGYVACSCRDCFETAIAVGDGVPAMCCWACEEAGCECDGECRVIHEEGGAS